MSAQEEFNKTYITSTEICGVLGITRGAVNHARVAGQLPNAIFIPEVPLYIWRRADIQPHIEAWDRRRKERAGLV